MKTIALDFDDTYTAMPAIWDAFIEACQIHGHSVTFVTARGEHAATPSYNHDIRTAAAKHLMEIVYTDGGQKSEHFEADIWIDDNPDWIPKMSLIRSMVELEGIGK